MAGQFRKAITSRKGTTTRTIKETVMAVRGMVLQTVRRITRIPTDTSSPSRDGGIIPNQFRKATPNRREITIRTAKKVAMAVMELGFHLFGSITRTLTDTSIGGIHLS